MSSFVTRSLPFLVTLAEVTPYGALPLAAMDRALAPCSPLYNSMRANQKDTTNKPQSKPSTKEKGITMTMNSFLTWSLPFLVTPTEATPAGALPLTAMDRALAPCSPLYNSMRANQKGTTNKPLSNHTREQRIITMSSRVTKSLPSLVAPAEATPAGTLPLTAMDRALASLPMAALFIFENPIDQPAESIRRALSRALVAYYPMAGRLTVTDDQLKIACTAEGVAFAGASASCTLQEARLSGPCPVVTVEDLTMNYGGQYSTDPPLLLVQVTEFSCGGFVVGVTWNHVVTDGAGMAQFLQVVGEFARGFPSSPSVLPLRVDHTLPELPPPITTMTKAMISSKHSDFPSSYITVPLSFINRVKDEFRRRSGGSDQVSSCTAFDVFVAAIWKSRARVTIGSATSQDAPTALIFTVNVRKPANAKDGYYGNVFAFGLAAPTLRDVADGDMLDIVKLVKDAKARVPHTFVDGAAHVADEMGGRLKVLNGYDTLYVTSWWNLGLDAVDFGSGGAERVIGDMERKVVPACILCGRKDKVEGVAAMALCVKPEHAEAFHAELRSLK